MRAGASDFILKPFRLAQILNAVQQGMERSRLTRENYLLRRSLQSLQSQQPAELPLVGHSLAMRRLGDALGRVAQVNSPVLLLGESGTGKELIARALRIRKMAGGGMRQAGMLAAAALYALDHHVDRLADDHALAQRLALGLQGIDGLQVRSAQTNIVFVDVADGRGPDLLAFLKERGVLATGLIGLRFVTHLDVDAAGIDRAVDAVQAFFSQGANTSTAPLAAGAAVY